MNKFQRIDKDGYIEIMIGKRKKIRFHRYVMELHLGRKLKPTEQVHHLDEDKQNNELANLIVVSLSLHNMIHAAINRRDYAKLRECAEKLSIEDRAKLLAWTDKFQRGA